MENSGKLSIFLLSRTLNVDLVKARRLASGSLLTEKPTQAAGQCPLRAKSYELGGYL